MNALSESKIIILKKHLIRLVQQQEAVLRHAPISSNKSWIGCIKGIDNWNRLLYEFLLRNRKSLMKSITMMAFIHI